MGSSDSGSERDASTHDPALPRRLQRSLERIRDRLWSVKIAEGALAGLIGLGSSYLLAFALERFFDTPAWCRSALLAAGFAVPALGLPLLWHRWVWRHRSLADAAQYLRRRHPRLGDELLGVIELARGADRGQSPALINAAMRQVDERVGDEDFSDSVPTRRHRRRLRATAVVLSAAVLLLVFLTDAARNTLVRWVSPWKQTERYTFAQLDPLPDRVVVPYGEAFPLEAALRDESAWSPDEAQLRLPGRGRLSAPREDGGYDFAIPPQKETGALSLRVGDAREEILVEPMSRPELTGVEALVRLPDYLRYSTDPVLPVRGSRFEVVEGSSATIRGTTSRELAAAAADGNALRVEGETFATDPIEVETGIERSFTWRDIHGLEAKSPLRLRLEPVPDGAPELFAHLVEPKRMVLEDEVVSFDLRADDDYGLREVGLEWRTARADEDPASAIEGEKPVATGAPEKTSLQVRGTFSARREGIPPGVYEVRAFANDFLPGRERVRSPGFVIQIASPSEHARWLTQEFAKWFRGARETYEREQRLHESNLALRALTPDELDLPENRRRLQDQGSAESANARRLDALAQAGRGLVGEATKNPEFEADRLERWAGMVRSLDQIAREGMPAVADRLQQAARAPGASAPPGSAPPPPRPQGASQATPDPGDGDRAGEPTSPPPTGLPETALANADPSPKPAAGSDTVATASPAQKSLDRALEEQRALLDEFNRVVDELATILASLESSTFVKRLKAAAQKQTEIADRIAAILPDSFGLPRQRIGQAMRETADAVAADEETQSDLVHHIQTDLEAFYQRKQETLYKRVLDQMKSEEVVAGLKRIAEESVANLSGRTVAASEYWADTFDRWAEELVAATPEPQQGQGEGKAPKGLPPELVLQIMRVLQEEMQLRDETREMEETRATFAPDVYASKVRPLAATQTDLRERIDSVVADILELPDARNFGKEFQLLTLVSDVMRQSHAVLSRPDTGPEAIAYETETIELLLQSKRQSSSGGGGEGSGSGSGTGSQGGGGGSALSDIGPQGREVGEGSPASREVDSTTGRAGRELPEEFRRGLDHYFNEIDSN